jgi:sterol desaturase/sphingolipid hydroxylase (fatty acid hydroxylase superfamily)
LTAGADQTFDLKTLVWSQIAMVEGALLLMVELTRWLLSVPPLLVLTAIGTHLVISSSQTLFHYGLGHHRMGGIFYRNHIRYHHSHYAEGHLVSSTHRRNDGNNTPYFLIPTALVAYGVYLALPLNLFLVVIIASAASFSAHVYLDKQYHAEGSSLARFAWFRRKQQLHFVHHLHGDSNFAVIDFFWDRVLGTHRSPDRDLR